MAGIQLVMVINEGGHSERCVGILRNYGAQTILTSAALGTATHEMLTLLGLSRSEKEVVFALCDEEAVRDLMTALLTGTRALAISTPMSSISMALFKKNHPADTQKREEAGIMTEMAKYEVIVAIANRGCIDLVMDSAREAGATGGTVIHARGAGAQENDRFFGVSIAEERDIYFIVVHASMRSEIMHSIIDGAGMKTPAKAVVFSLPISHLAGFPQFTAQEKK